MPIADERFVHEAVETQQGDKTSLKTKCKQAVQNGE
jgi:hypothetical protein